ncbi:hypothetical protein LNP17_20475 [Klebsiella variicola subsp. variicola]|nr:hypothetical protein [Klebsiella variicola subsp. variicola]
MISVTTEEAYARRATPRPAGRHFVGISSGANVAAAARLARTLPAGSVVVTAAVRCGLPLFDRPFLE